MTIRALWPERWPAVALVECVDKLNAVEVQERGVVEAELPCADCRANEACLTAKKKELGGLIFDREIKTKPRSSESSLFPRELFEKWLRPDQSFVPHYRKPMGVESRFAVVSAWDLAWSEKTGGDFLVKMTAKVDLRTGRRALLDIWRGQKLTFSQQVQLIQEEWAKYGDDLVVIESDASQQIWAQYLGEMSAVLVAKHSAGGKQDLSTGVPGLIMELDSGRWEFPFEKGSFHHDNMEVFLDECEAFGWKDGKLQGVGEHDDTVMCWYHLAYGCSLMLSASRASGVARGGRGSI